MIVREVCDTVGGEIFEEDMIEIKRVGMYNGTNI